MRRALLAAVLGLLLAAPSASAITGGRLASEPYPWMASVRVDGDHLCGGSLVRADYVLTAAHCVQGGDPAEYSVMLGETRLSRDAGEKIAVAEIVIHENYAEDDAGGHDIALLRLASPSTASTLPLVALSDRALWAPGVTARVIGWGSSVYLVGPGSDDLMEVDVPMIADDECEASYTLSPFSFDATTMVCAGETTGLRDSCQGDSGGPLVVKDSAGAWTQVGTVSFGLGCGFPLYYGVYGRTGDTVLHDWLVAHLPAPSTASAPPPPPAEPAALASPPAQPTTSPARAAGARIIFARNLGSARKARRSRAVRLRLRSTAPVTALEITLTRGGKRVARGRIARLAGRKVMRLRVRRSALRRGAFALRIVGRDAGGHPVGATGRLRLR